MPLRKTIQDIIVTGTETLRDGVRQYFGTGQDQSIRFDPDRGANGALVITDEQNSTDQAVIEIGTTLPDELASDGNTPIAQGTLNAQPPTAHAADHKDGGPDELDAAELAGSSGVNGQFLKSDGAAAEWADAPTGSTVAIEQDDLSDATFYKGSVTSGNTLTLVDVSNTSGILLPGSARFSGGGGSLSLTVDGAATQTFTLPEVDFTALGGVPPVVFQSSITVELTCNNATGATGWVV